MAGKNKKTAKAVGKWVAIGLACVAAVGAAFGIVKLVKGDYETLKPRDYVRYTLDDETGEADKDDKSGLTTKGFYALKNLTIELDPDAEISYQINYYDAQHNFLGVNSYDQDFTDDFAKDEIAAMEQQGAVDVRIEIIPNADEDGEIGTFEKLTYAKQLTVKVYEGKEKADEKEETEEKTDTEESGNTATE